MWTLLDLTRSSEVLKVQFGCWNLSFKVDPANPSSSDRTWDARTCAAHGGSSVLRWNWSQASSTGSVASCPRKKCMPNSQRCEKSKTNTFSPGCCFSTAMTAEPCRPACHVFRLGRWESSPSHFSGPKTSIWRALRYRPSAGNHDGGFEKLWKRKELHAEWYQVGARRHYLMKQFLPRWVSFCLPFQDSSWLHVDRSTHKNSWCKNSVRYDRRQRYFNMTKLSTTWLYSDVAACWCSVRRAFARHQKCDNFGHVCRFEGSWWLVDFSWPFLLYSMYADMIYRIHTLVLLEIPKKNPAHSDKK